MNRTIFIRCICGILCFCLVSCQKRIDDNDKTGNSRPTPKRAEQTGRGLQRAFDSPPGLWSHAVGASSQKPEVSDELKQELERLQGLGYLRGYTRAPSGKNVTIYDEQRAYNALSFYVSGHAPEVILIDMNGEEIHKWRCDFSQAFPDWPASLKTLSDKFFRRAYVYENGDVLAIFESIGLVKIDKDSNLLWASQCRAHHDISIIDERTIYVLTKKHHIDPTVNATEGVTKDFISVLDARGNVIRRVSLLDAFRNSSHASALRFMKTEGDLFHTNTLEVFDGTMAHISPLFKKGNALVCVRELDIVAIVDMEEGKTVWSLAGMWVQPHESILLSNGHMLIFDNKGHNKKSKVLEFNPFTQEIYWLYDGDSTRKLHSETLGSCQRLPNGNTLISESHTGRAVEVAPDKTTVWEWINPHRAGDNDELVATLCEMVRLDQDFSLDWLD